MSKSNRKVIITCAVTGAVHTPTMSEYLPLTPDQIAEQSIEAVEAGASILHLHARDPNDGRPSPDPALFKQFIPRIAEATDAVINITTGGSTRMTLEERLAFPLLAKPEMCSLNMGSMNFSIHPVARKITEWKYDWEKPFVEGMEDLIFRNTFKDIAYILKTLGDEGTRFELECYDVGHLYNLAYFVDEGLIKPPFFIQSIYGILGGMGPDPENMAMMRTVADRLFGRDAYEFSILGAGRHQMHLLTMGAIMGGNVRVGLEDSIYLGKGVKAKSNAEQVRKIRHILEELSFEIATPAEAREILQLKGKDKVTY
ncbi:3-keto-5-aminohexanoate cleavage protein [Caballeronia novacaledonica]|uniref:3-keto-5-aminohexanoate cleavage protein n=1 Tax=Caballeronia novacaledonica TaxID=1544861 RepID=A0AA37MT72_9BURK|nr:3-keto-5-aminohexanoate cleavage protein [Caballeronia novacaledonica]GJH26999.1 3-keto-5-aminohexanoate cleavage protein [Caballeronia novacaledonica]